ncbi:AraC-type DNA-binding protein [Amycolatopsis arida]|uniref:AraC-type DNA-binding protein n=1 Tax=Amycolatopsis arida TaxID=587909 RepID=A0A1I5QEE0_9PSEU|nr:AraC-like DNA-binding protein [Amycolatopsis arida]SFP44669.1 AraC-type DNA-binding protein [Amycolatopsis arida]
MRGAWTRYQRHAFAEPAPDLARYVARYWMVRWDYRVPYHQLIVPYPNVHLTFRDGAATVQGVCRGRQTRVLAGRGRVLGVAFRAGCFRPFLDAPVSTITDRTVPAAEVFGPGVPGDPDVAEVERFLRARLPAPDPRADEAAGIVARIAARPEITRVDLLADDLGTSVRGLQRLFAEHVGVGPKWVIRRYRLWEVTQRLEEGASIDWAALAVELGYADQAHFVHDFTKMFDESPTRYAERY